MPLPVRIAAPGAVGEVAGGAVAEQVERRQHVAAGDDDAAGRCSPDSVQHAGGPAAGGGDGGGAVAEAHAPAVRLEPALQRLATASRCRPWGGPAA